VTLAPAVEGASAGFAIMGLGLLCVDGGHAANFSAAAAERNRQLSALLSWLARSMFSQEKPPSFSGARPK
jgi:hypothetical protein